MKTLLLTALSLLLFTPCFSQIMKAPPQHGAEAGPKWLSSTPGLELKKAGRSHFIALGCETFGVLLISAGAAQQYSAPQNVTGSSNTTSTAGAGDEAIGSLLLITGGVFNILAWVHINHAGKLMEGNKVTFGSTKNGIGLTYKF